MRKNKLMALGLVAAMAIGTLAGCSAAEAPATEETEGAAEETVEEPAEEAESGEKTKVLVWSGNSHDSEYMNEMVAKFNEENTDGIEIEYVVTTDNYVNMIQMGIQSDQAPDIFNMGPSNKDFDLKSFVDAGMLLPVDEYMSDDFKATYDLEKLAYPNVNTIDGTFYYVPTAQRSGMRLIYNKELFELAGIENPPTTLEEMVDAAAKVTEVGEGTKFGIGHPGLSSPMVRIMEPMAEMSGILPYNYVDGKFDFTGYKPIIEGVRQMFDDGSTLPGVTSMKIDPLRVQFSEGNVGMYGNASQEVGVLTEQFPAKIEWAVAEMPTLNGEVVGAQTAEPQNGWVMTSTCKNPEAAWKVAEFFSSVEVMKGYVEKGYSLSNSQVVMDQVDQSAIGKLAEFGVYDYEGFYPKYPAVTPEGKVWQEVVWTLCSDSTLDIDSTLTELTDAYNTALDKDVEMGKVTRLVIKDFDPMKPGAGTFEYLTK